jgi:hypothetical protein
LRCLPDPKQGYGIFRNKATFTQIIMALYRVANRDSASRFVCVGKPVAERVACSRTFIVHLSTQIGTKAARIKSILQVRGLTLSESIEGRPVLSNRKIFEHHNNAVSFGTHCRTMGRTPLRGLSPAEVQNIAKVRNLISRLICDIHLVEHRLGARPGHSW